MQIPGKCAIALPLDFAVTASLGLTHGNFFGFMTPTEIYDIYAQPGESLRSTARKIAETTGIHISHWTVRQRLIRAGYELKPVGNAEVENPLTEVVYGRVEPEIKEWLRSLGGEESAHVREALRWYRAARMRGDLF